MNLILTLENRNDLFKEVDFRIPSKIEFDKQKREINRSTLYNFDGPFQVLHADVANLEFSKKFAVSIAFC